MTKHKHHIVPRHKGGDDSPDNIVELDFIEHARLHAERFLSGEDNWFDCRHKGWPYLEEELRQAVSQRISEINSTRAGELHPNFGKHIHSEEFKLRRSLDMRGEGNHRFGVKMSNSTKDKISASHLGRIHGQEFRKNCSIRQSKPVLVFDPYGNIYFHASIKEAAEFHNLSRGPLSRVMTNKITHTKKFTGRFIFHG